MSTALGDTIQLGGLGRALFARDPSLGIPDRWFDMTVTDYRTNTTKLDVVKRCNANARHATNASKKT